MGRTAANLSALALVLLSGLGHGLWTGRWRVSHAIEAAVSRIDHVPAAFGDWESRPLELNRKMLVQAEVDGYLSRRYRNRRDGSEVTVLLVCGRSGPVSLHTPDVCYEGAGYDVTATPDERRGPGIPAAFKMAEFRKRGPAVPETLIIAWSWNATGTWEAPDRPRLRFAPFPALYKLYIVRPAASADLQAEAGIVGAFLNGFLPELDRALFPRVSR